MRDASDSERPRTTLQTAQRALAFLEFVAQAVEPPRLKDVATALGLNITTCYHLFNTLQEAGYVVRNSGGQIRVGGRVSVLYNGLVRQLISGRELHPVVSTLSARTQETAYLTSLSDNGVVIQSVIEGSHAVRVTGLYVGFSGAEHVRASGKAVLAYMDPAERETVLDSSMRGMDDAQRRSATRRLERELAEVRTQGWAFDDQYFEDTVCCVAAPYFEATGEVAGSVAVSVPAGRFADRQEQLTADVCRAADEASEVLGQVSPLKKRITA